MGTCSGSPGLTLICYESLVLVDCIQSQSVSVVSVDYHVKDI